MAGNIRYESADDLPDVVPVFPLSGALLLPSGQMPLNIFEPRYLAMVDAALAGERVIGMVQPALDAAESAALRRRSARSAVSAASRNSPKPATGATSITLSGVTPLPHRRGARCYNALPPMPHFGRGISRI